MTEETKPKGALEIEPEKLADINKRFADIDAQVTAAKKHPTATTRGSTMINHADGTWSHFSYTRSATVAEYEQSQMASEDPRKPARVDWWRTMKPTFGERLARWINRFF